MAPIPQRLRNRLESLGVLGSLLDPGAPEDLSATFADEDGHEVGTYYPTNPGGEGLDYPARVEATATVVDGGGMHFILMDPEMENYSRIGAVRNQSGEAKEATTTAVVPEGWVYILEGYNDNDDILTLTNYREQRLR